MKAKSIYPVAEVALNAMREMRQWTTVEQLEKWKDGQSYEILFDGDFIAEYKKFHERLRTGKIEQPTIILHMNPVNSKYHCDNCKKYGVAEITQYHLHFCSTDCSNEYNNEAGAIECDEERQRMSGDNFYTEKFYNE